VTASLVLDSHLLLLFVVGTTSRDYISKHKRLREYTQDDFTLLSELVSSAQGVFVTPNTLTEASNLVGYIGEPARGHIYEVLGALIQSTEERYQESRRAAGRSEFLRLGLTDAVLLEATGTSHTLLTADLDLYLAATARGGPAVNFNHLRAEYL
jgi:hypothetical protein